MGRIFRIFGPPDAVWSEDYLHFLCAERIMPYHVIKGEDGKSVPILSSGASDITTHLDGKFNKEGKPVVSFNGKDFTPVPSEGLIFIQHHDGHCEFLNRKEFDKKYKLAAWFGDCGEKWFYAVDNKDTNYLNRYKMRTKDFELYEKNLEDYKNPHGYWYRAHVRHLLKYEQGIHRCVNLFDYEFIIIPEKVTRIKGIILEGYCSVTLPKSLKKVDGLVMRPGSKVNFPDGFVLKAEDVLGWNDYKSFSREEVDKLVAEHCRVRRVVKADVSKGVDSGVEKVEDKRKKNAVKKYKGFSNKTSAEKDKGLKVK